jgi:hypothetical protein
MTQYTHDPAVIVAERVSDPQHYFVFRCFIDQDGLWHFPCEVCGLDLAAETAYCSERLQNERMNCIVEIMFCSELCHQKHVTWVNERENWINWRMHAILDDAVLTLYQQQKRHKEANEPCD